MARQQARNRRANTVTAAVWIGEAPTIGPPPAGLPRALPRVVFRVRLRLEVTAGRVDWGPTIGPPPAGLPRALPRGVGLGLGLGLGLVEVQIRNLLRRGSDGRNL